MGRVGGGCLRDRNEPSIAELYSFWSVFLCVQVAPLPSILLKGFDNGSVRRSAGSNRHRDGSGRERALLSNGHA
jgi:hypothetical protein